jgi:long-chain acyl-CoA synthetase
MTNADRPWTKFYDDGIGPDLDMPDRSCVEVLEQSFRDFPDRPAFHFLGATRTFRDLDRDSRRFAGFLRHIGCEPGDVVAICLPNSPQYLIALVGTLRAGCVATGVSLLLAPREMANQFEDSGARVLVTLDALFEQKFLKIRDPLARLSHVVVANIGDFLPWPKRVLGKALRKIPTGQVVPVPGKTILMFMDVLRQHAEDNHPAPRDPDDTCLIMYTGGTTGLPKGAEITSRNLVAMACLGKTWMKAERGKEVFCSAFPFFHIAGLGVCFWNMATGSTQILVPNPRDTRQICRDIARYRPTFLLNVPSLYQLLLCEPTFESLRGAPLGRLKSCLSGAAPFSTELLEPLEAVVGQGMVVEIYGMTETTALIAVNPSHGKKKPGSVGLPLPGTQVKFVDLETGTREVPLGQEGQVIVHGPQVLKCYHNKPDETANALREFEGRRWLYTGDVGRMDDEGYVFLMDRTKDMLNVGGFKVFSREAEQTLCEHPAVEMCAIIGMPNPERPGSDIVKAVIQLAPEYKNREPQALQEELVRYCRENMAPYKVPKVIEFIDKIPMTPIGKIDKKALR